MIQPISRRMMLKAAGSGFGYLALAGLTTEAAAAQNNPLAPKQPHFAPRAKRVIMLSMQGGPSHVDTFDYKPKLAENAGKTVTATSGQVQDRNRGRALLPSPWKFEPHGQSRLYLSELFPHLAKHADDLCLINSLCTDVPNHPQAFLMLHTGEFRFTRPSVGAWLLYGLGTENQDLPGFVTISPPANLGGAQNYGNGFLAASYQGTRIGEQGAAVANAKIGNIDCPHLTPSQQRRQLDLLQAMNQDLLQRNQVDAALEGVINSFELSFRMQAALPKVLDISKEPAKTLQMYGIGRGGQAAGNRAGGGGTDDFGRQCLMARRLVEAGVRYVEVCHGGWDTHNGLKARLGTLCGSIDQPIAALLTDLKERGLLKDTLVIWGGEFGRTPAGQGTDGRDHNSAGFSMWLAGGGTKGGQRVGATDENGGIAVENKCHHHDLHATVLHLLGLDHQKLTFRYGGRDYSLTDIHGRVVKEVMA
jgi:hypothetical protein